MMRGMNDACVDLIYRAAPSWDSFQRSLKRAFSMLNDQFEMNLGDD